MSLQPICQKCRRRPECTKPCYPVQKILTFENGDGLAEIPFSMGGKDYKMNFGRNTVFVRHSDMSEKASMDMERLIDETADLEEGLVFKPVTKRAEAFYLRYFKGWDRNSIAEAMDVSPDVVSTMLTDSMEKVKGILDQLNTRQTILTNMSDKRFSETEKAFILVKIFNFTYDECEEFGLGKRETVRKRITKMYDDIAPFFDAEAIRKKHAPVEAVPDTALREAPGVTPMQKEILTLIRGGMTRKEIMDRMGLSAPKLRNHLYEIRKANGMIKAA